MDKNFVYWQISKILSEFLLNSCDILKLKISLNAEFNELKT